MLHRGRKSGKPGQNKIKQNIFICKINVWVVNLDLFSYHISYVSKLQNDFGYFFHILSLMT